MYNVSCPLAARLRAAVPPGGHSPGDRAEGSRRVRYNAANQAYEARTGNGQTTRFWYGSDGQRYKREDGARRTLYLGNVEIVTEGGRVTLKRIVAGVALQLIVGQQASTYYQFHDRLGSLIRLTDAAGTVLGQMDFQGFGGRRHPDTLRDDRAPNTRLSTRGYTGHEMIDGALGLIHMNARMFDPQLGRFLQVDPVVQAPENAQSWNAYTYVFNNPYAYTDPTGMIGVKERQWLAVIVGVVAAVFGQYYLAQQMYAAAFLVTVAGGAAAAGIATQSWSGAAKGAFTAALTFGIGYGVASDVAQIAAQAVTGGVMEWLQGGQFGSGFLSAGLTAAFMPQVGRIGNDMGRIVTGALVGGTISEVTGGKFANGAASGAIQAAMMRGDHAQRDMDQDAAQSDGEWIYPNGGSTNINDYDTVMTNGIKGDRDAFVAALNSSPTPAAGYFNPSGGFVADIWQSFRQKFFGRYGDPLAARFAKGLSDVDHSMTIIAHSQGTLTVTNAARYYGLPRGSSFVLRSPALSYSSARSAVNINGGSMQYVQSWGDVANIYAPTINPLKWLSGFRDLMCGMCAHSANGLP
ncbi:hypothetical protein EBB59_12155 [Lysobacter pythonis]|uniref:Teneurin-like YD-shell domain-containing protein n=1 Tax=Solilutibacter pythonis TaxID=2483112 RepID=A0A3M2HL70_9GAMM|nr:RHS repeat-associated core domain-containing protein [Lysobacter pythonis]RMH88119.1 hypothetical protein EBB59_12155 [Lysobacter pythonis]